MDLNFQSTLSEKVFISPLLLKDNLQGRNSDWCFFSFNSLNISFSSCLHDFWWEVCWSYYLFFYRKGAWFSPALFKDSLFVFAFLKFDRCLGVVWVFILFVALWVSHVWDLVYLINFDTEMYSSLEGGIRAGMCPMASDRLGALARGRGKEETVWCLCTMGCGHTDEYLLPNPENHCAQPPRTFSAIL